MANPFDQFDAADANPFDKFDAKPMGRAAADRDAKRRVKSTPDQVRAVSRGFSFGLSDELDAGSAALETGGRNLLARVAGKKPEYGMGDAYNAVMDASQQADSAYAQAHPVQNIGLNILGGMVGPGMATASRYVGNARNLLSATGRSALVGSGVGAVTGAASGRGVEGRLREAGKGALTGAVVGAALPSAGRLAQTAGRAANAAVGQPFGGAARGAAARLAEALQRDGLSPADVRNAVQHWQQSGVTPEFLNVAGENTRALIRAAGSQAGNGRNAAQAYRDTTVASIPNRAIERANALTPGETRTPAQFAEQATEARGATADHNYGEWSDTMVDVPDTVLDMLADSSGRSIIARARADAIENQDWGRQVELDRLLTAPAEGGVGPIPRISAGTVDRLVIAARERGAAFARRGNGNRARGAFERRGQLDNVLSNVDEVRPSRQAYEQQSRAIEAAEGGPSVMGPRSEFQPAHDAIAGNPEAVRGAQIRERQALRDNFGTRDQVRGRLADIANAPDVRPNLNQLFGERGEQFANAAGNLVRKQDHANYIAPNTGSQTQSRGQDAAGAFGAIRNIAEAVGGNIRPLVERMARGLTMTEREKEVLIQLGIGTPDEALRALAAGPGPRSQAIGAAARRAGLASPGTRQPAVEVSIEGRPDLGTGRAYGPGGR